jgi:hypothetical protein
MFTAQGLDEQPLRDEMLRTIEHKPTTDSGTKAILAIYGMKIPIGNSKNLSNRICDHCIICVKSGNTNWGNIPLLLTS